MPQLFALKIIIYDTPPSDYHPFPDKNLLPQDIYGNRLPQDRAMSAFVQTITNVTYLESIGRINMREDNGKIYYYRES
ncbi:MULTISPECIES: hypothetical protein [Bacillaceae]|uniref:hypothetical protein n=1 Tax=Bacillaceae TaxID=186817 RepID=UPI000E72E56C|nr:hypothetical protein [Bacillus sp. PK3_68]RJS58893.1 hypothetical protein CJ483_01480 [Bacillus sp. PK3_68]